MLMASGAVLQPDDSCSFELWAPALETVFVEMISTHAPRRVAMLRDEQGVHRAALPAVSAGARYRFASGDRTWADPASRHQPDGVHGPSAIVDPRFAWTDQRWRGRPIDEAVIYELHIGTFTAAGTFDAAIDELDRLAALGITAIELMPVAQCPGARNWGYDGAFPFAVAHAYGGPNAMRRFVNACHARGLAVVLDVVYNHFGPEGARFGELAPIYREDCRTPWGAALNFDGPDSDGVRRFFLDNAAMWMRDYHVDGLRLDAVHSIIDMSPHPFLAELAELATTIGQASWPRWMIAESDANDPRILRPQPLGLGLDAVWADDFHHAVHRLLTGEQHGYYADYEDRELLVRAIEDGFAYSGQYSRYHRRRLGAPATGLLPQAFVVCVQNHDQIGNRALGDRLVAKVDKAAAAMAMALLLLSPHVPLLFMGEEYGETAPFLFFTDHGDEGVIEATRSGRRAEHPDVRDPPDPQAIETMTRCVINPRKREQSPYRERETLVHRLLNVRRMTTFAAERSACRCALQADGKVLLLAYGERGPVGVFVLEGANPGPIEIALPAGQWTVGIDGADPQFGGAGPVLEQVVRGTVRIEPPPYWFAVLHRSDPA